jgi:SAM-dependent methyltransferase
VQADLALWHRYLFATEMCTNRDVLHLTTSDGPGASLLLSIARSIVSLHAGGEHLPLSNHEIDVVVSLEAVCAFRVEPSFLSELKRVLRPGGRLIMCCPTPDVRLEASFAHTAALKQHSLVGSSLIADFASTNYQARDRRACDTVLREDNGPEPAPACIVYIASDSPIHEVLSSRLITRSALDDDRSLLHRMLPTLLRCRDQLRQREDEHHSLALAYRKLWDAYASALAENESAQTRLSEVLHSTSWRVTRPLRFLTALRSNASSDPSPPAEK